MKRYLPAAILAALLGGCDFLVYEIDLTPRGRDLDRTLTVWNGGSIQQEEGKAPEVKEVGQGELELLAKAYDGRKGTSR